MKFINENIIDEIIERLDAADDNRYEQYMDEFSEAQPVVIAYLFNDENFHLLTEDEKGFLHYLCLIAWLSVVQVNGPVEAVGEDQLGEAEEHNFALLENAKGNNFRARLDALFEDYPQEDLLAFAEEAVLEDEDDPDAIVTKEGRELIFIAAKTVIDTLIGYNQH